MTNTITIKMEEAQLRRKEELKKIEKDIEEEKKRYAIAVGEGDLRENVDYVITREKLAKLNSLKKSILRSIEVYNDFNKETNKSDFISVGSVVTIQTEDNKFTVKIVPPALGDASIGALSINSPVGRALESRVLGDYVEVVTPSRTLTYKVISIHKED